MYERKGGYRGPKGGDKKPSAGKKPKIVYCHCEGGPHIPMGVIDIMCGSKGGV